MTWIALTFAAPLVAPVWGRGLKYKRRCGIRQTTTVAPVWGRGLKWDVLHGKKCI